METLPPQLSDRLSKIFSSHQMNDLKDIFSLKKRPTSFRVNTLKSTPEEVEKALMQASITYTKLDFPKNSYILDDEFTESDLWKRRIYKD